MEIMLENWKTSTVVRIENENNDTKRFWFQVAEVEVFDFIPGQFVTLDLPIHEKKNKRWRSYSIASAPSKTNIFELVIVLLENGAGTNYLFNEVTVGTEIKFRGPIGKLSLPEKLDKNLMFICTGTGIAPFRSMIKFILENEIPHQRIDLVFGCRKFSDTLYEKEFLELQNKYPTFNFHPTFSRETEVSTGQYKGYVHHVYENIIHSLNKPDTNFYLCGWKKMIDEGNDKIINLGYEKKDIHFELYG